MAICKFCGADTGSSGDICESCVLLLGQVKGELPTQKVNGFLIEDYENNRELACICYLPALCWLPWCLRPHSQYLQFHCNQGLTYSIFFAIASGLWALLHFLYRIAFTVVYHPGTVFAYARISGTGRIWMLITSILFGGIILFYLIFGAYSALRGSGKPLPLIGRFRLIPFDRLKPQQDKSNNKR